MVLEDVHEYERHLIKEDKYLPPATVLVNVGADAMTADEVTSDRATLRVLKVVALVKVVVMPVTVTAGLFMRTV